MAKQKQEKTQPTLNEELDKLIASANTLLGSQMLRKLSGNEVANMPRLSTGVLSLDIGSGGGYPWGRIVEIYGPESSGKTTLILEAIAQAQKEGRVCAFIDAEHALDVMYARNLGVNTDDLIIMQPDTGEQALQAVELLVNSGLIDVIVVDSVAALVPKAELEGDMGQSHVGLQARLMSQALRKLNGPIQRNNVLVFFINQIRHKIGVMFGSPETTSGGNALKFYASIRMDIRRTGSVKVAEEITANETRVTFKKNKTAPPYRESKFQISFGKGINKNLDLLRQAVNFEVVEKSGAWYSYDGNRLGQGELNASNTLGANPEMHAKVFKLVSDKALPKVEQLVEVEPEVV